MGLLELFSQRFFGEIAVAFITCSAVSMLAVTGLLSRQSLLFSFAFTVLSFSILGYITGSIMSNSREPAVNAVLPAALTLLGGVAAFVVGSKDSDRQTAVSAIVFSFALSLYIGADYGAMIRDKIDMTFNGVEKLRNNLNYESDLDRLEKYVELVRLKQSFEKQYDIDLSKFSSSFDTSGKQK